MTELPCATAPQRGGAVVGVRVGTVEKTLISAPVCVKIGYGRARGVLASAGIKDKDRRG